MAITWRNIGQSSPTGNSLIQGGADTITEGLGTLRNVAREVGQNQIDEFNKEAEVNTADLLNRIQNSDKGNLQSFDINKLKSQFGNAFDATAITEGIGDRTEELRTIARQQSEDARLAAAEIRADKQLVLAQQAAALDSLRTVSTLKVNEQTTSLEKSRVDSVIDLNEQNLTISQAEQAELSNFSTANNYLIDNLGNYSDLNSLEQAAITKAKELKLNPANTAALVSSATSIWNTAIEPSPEDLNVINTMALNAAETNAETATEARRKLDLQAKRNGLNPILLDFAQDTTVDLDDVVTSWNEKVKEANLPWKEDSAGLFLKTFTDKFQRPPTGKEANYFLAMAFSEGILGFDDGFDQDLITDDLDNYHTMLTVDVNKVNAYLNAQRAINQGERSFESKTAAQIEKLKKTLRDNNRYSLGQDPYDVDPRNRELDPKDIDFTKYINQGLTKTDWFKGK